MAHWMLGVVRGPTIEVNGKPEPFGNLCEAFGHYIEDGGTVSTKIVVGIGYTPTMAVYNLAWKIKERYNEELEGLDKWESTLMHF